MRSDIIDIEVHVHARTDKGIRVSATGQQIDAEWLPLSQVEIEPHQNLQRVYVLSVPEWLAIKRGLV